MWPGLVSRAWSRLVGTRLRRSLAAATIGYAGGDRSAVAIAGGRLSSGRRSYLTVEGCTGRRRVDLRRRRGHARGARLASRPTLAARRPQLLAGPHPVLGLEVDQHVGAARAAPRSGPGARARSGARSSSEVPRAELDVQVDVAPRPRATRAQLVVADHAAVGELLDRRRGSPRPRPAAAPRRRARARSAPAAARR